ncbi:MAG: hypothetical protein QXY40_04315 [Candidatus Methanomethylicia archaeon]
MRKTILYFRNNVAGTANVAKACLDSGVKLTILTIFKLGFTGSI